MPRGAGWLNEADLQLCRSWVAISMDEMVGAGQKLEQFNQRLYQNWVDGQPVGLRLAEQQSLTAVASRWKRISPKYSKFTGIARRVFGNP